MNPELKMGEEKKMRRKRLTYLQTRKVSIQQKKKTQKKQNRIRKKKKANKTIKYRTIPTSTLSGVIRKTVPKRSYIIL